MEPPSQKVESVDELSSVTTLGLAVAGSALMLVAYWILGS